MPPLALDLLVTSVHLNGCVLVYLAHGDARHIEALSSLRVYKSGESIKAAICNSKCLNVTNALTTRKTGRSTIGTRATRKWKYEVFRERQGLLSGPPKRHSGNLRRDRSADVYHPDNGGRIVLVFWKRSPGAQRRDLALGYKARLRRALIFYMAPCLIKVLSFRLAGHPFDCAGLLFAQCIRRHSNCGVNGTK